MIKKGNNLPKEFLQNIIVDPTWESMNICAITPKNFHGRNQSKITWLELELFSIINTKTARLFKCFLFQTWRKKKKKKRISFFFWRFFF